MGGAAHGPKKGRRVAARCAHALAIGTRCTEVLSACCRLAIARVSARKTSWAEQRFAAQADRDDQPELIALRIVDDRGRLVLRAAIARERVHAEARAERQLEEVAGVCGDERAEARPVAARRRIVRG